MFERYLRACKLDGMQLGLKQCFCGRWCSWVYETQMIEKGVWSCCHATTFVSLLQAPTKRVCRMIIERSKSC